MQLMPDTADFIARKSGGTAFEQGDLASPQVNIAYGSWLLRYLLDHYDGERSLALAAYNAGQGNVDDWVASARGARRGLHRRRAHPVPGDARVRRRRSSPRATTTAASTPTSSGSDGRGMRRWAAIAGVALVVAGAAAVVALWWTSAEATGAAAGRAGRVARLSGLLGAYLVLVELLLLARLPLLDRLYGFGDADRLAPLERPRLRVAARRPRAADRRRLRARRRPLAARRAAAPDRGVPGRDHGDRRARAAARGRRLLGGDRAPAAALRDLVLRPPLRVPRRRARLQPSARVRDGVRRPPARAHVLDRALRRDARRDRRLPDRPAAGPQPAPPAARGPRGRGGAGLRLDRDRRRRPGPARRAQRAVLRLALPDPRPLVGVAPVLALGRARARPAADHGQGRRRLQRPARDAARPARG